MIKSIQLHCKFRGKPVASMAARLFRRIVKERSGITVARETGELKVVLTMEPGVGVEGFRIDDADGGVRIAGNDERGLLYGVGKYLRSCRFTDDGMEPGAWRGTSVPAKPVRGMYFATHFHNFYHDAPVKAVERYVEELALWGCNALSVWFDMHHYQGIDDPAAVAMIERLRMILAACERVGMAPGLTTLSNEAYASSPKELRADWTAGHDGYTSPPGGHYHVEICPSKPGGLEKILEYRRGMLEAFKGIDIRYVWLWPYDQGGCTCPQCKPWGANGFMKTAEAEARLVRQVFPSAKTIFSTWYFDHFTKGEWEGVSRAFAAKKPEWVDYVMADDFGGFPEYPLRNGIPGGFPAVGFPEISMELMWPWGGFGANPRPAHWQEYWDKARNVLSGFFPYSEGIYEDMNKVLTFQFLWDPDRSADEILGEYAAGEFDPGVANDAVQVCHQLEAGLGHALSRDFVGRVWKIQEAGGDGGSAADGLEKELRRKDLYELRNVKEPAACFEAARQIDGRLPAWARRSWRWRMVWLRAALDHALSESKGNVTKETEKYFKEIERIAHARTAEMSVLPPGRRALRRLVRKMAREA